MWGPPSLGHARDGHRRVIGVGNWPLPVTTPRREKLRGRPWNGGAKVGLNRRRPGLKELIKCSPIACRSVEAGHLCAGLEYRAGRNRAASRIREVAVGVGTETVDKGAGLRWDTTPLTYPVTVRAWVGWFVGPCPSSEWNRHGSCGHHGDQHFLEHSRHPSVSHLCYRCLQQPLNAIAAWPPRSLFPMIRSTAPCLLVSGRCHFYPPTSVFRRAELGPGRHSDSGLTSPLADIGAGSSATEVGFAAQQVINRLDERAILSMNFAMGWECDGCSGAVVN